MPDKEIKLNVVREKVCKNSIRVQAMGEAQEFAPIGRRSSISRTR